MKKFLSRIMPMVLAIAIVCPYGIIGAEAASVNNSLNFDDFASNITAISGLENADGETRGKMSSDADNAYNGFGFYANSINANAYFFVKDGALGYRQTPSSNTYNQRVTIALPNTLPVLQGAADATSNYLIDFNMKAYSQSSPLNIRMNTQETTTDYKTDLTQIVNQNTVENTFNNYSIKCIWERNNENNWGRYTFVLYKNGKEIFEVNDINANRLKYLDFYTDVVYANQKLEILLDDLSVRDLPTVLTATSSVENNATDVSCYNDITFKLSETMTADSLEKIVVTRDGATDTTVVPTYNAATKTITIPGASLVGEAEYSIDLSGIEDICGNKLAEDANTYTFKTRIGTLSVQPITVNGIENRAEYNNQTDIAASVIVENKAKEFDAVMYIAYYEGSNLKTVKPETVRVIKGKQTLNAQATLSPAQTGGYFKVFLFDKETLEPLTGAFVTTAKQ